MTQVSIPAGFYWPWTRPAAHNSAGNGVIDLTGEKWALIGRVFWNGRPAGAKTIDTSGSSKIGIQLGAAVFDNASSIVDIGIQGVGTAGPSATPDGIFSVKAVVTTAADTVPALTTGSVMNFATPTTGTVSLTHGDLIAVVIDFVNRAGSDSLSFPITNVDAGGANPIHFPISNAFVGSVWNATGVGWRAEGVVLVASDGTLGTLDGILLPMGALTTVVFADASNPDEYGMIFQVPWDCKIDALWASILTAGATSDFTMDLFSGAETTPVSLLAAPIAVDAAQLGGISVIRPAEWNLPAEVSLTRGVDYCVSVKATGAGNISLSLRTLSDAGHRVFSPAGTTVRRVTRNGGSGAFGSSSTVIMIPIGVRISSFDNGAGSGGGGGLKLAGRGGLAG